MGSACSSVGSPGSWPPFDVAGFECDCSMYDLHLAMCNVSVVIGRDHDIAVESPVIRRCISWHEDCRCSLHDESECECVHQPFHQCQIHCEESKSSVCWLMSHSEEPLYNVIDFDCCCKGVRRVNALVNGSDCEHPCGPISWFLGGISLALAYVRTSVQDQEFCCRVESFAAARTPYDSSLGLLCVGTCVCTKEANGVCVYGSGWFNGPVEGIAKCLDHGPLIAPLVLFDCAFDCCSFGVMLCECDEFSIVMQSPCSFDTEVQPMSFSGLVDFLPSSCFCLARGFLVPIVKILSMLSNSSLP